MSRLRFSMVAGMVICALVTGPVSADWAKPVRLTVVDSEGRPVAGGAITWKLKDGSAWSARTYGLTDDGVIDFPAVAPGLADVTIKRAVTASGVVVSGSATVDLSESEPSLTLPDMLVPPARTVRVVMPNGMPVANAKVTVTIRGEVRRNPEDCYWDDDGNEVCGDNDVLDPANVVDRMYVDDFTFVVSNLGYTSTCPRDAYEGTCRNKTLKVTRFTDANGQVVFKGFFFAFPSATVLYSDGVIVQKQEVELIDGSTKVELGYMPWLEVSQSAFTAQLDSAVPVSVSVAEPEYLGAARSSVAASRRAGVAVTVVPPKHAPKGSCGARLTGKTNTQGRVTLKVCATKSGVYGFKTSGAVPVSRFSLFVKGTAPMPVTSVTARSLAVGSIRATWAAPLFDGGSKIVSYKVTASAKGKKTVTKTVKSNVKKVTLDGLANATTYTVKITATTKKGTSDPVTVSVPVA